MAQISEESAVNQEPTEQNAMELAGQASRFYKQGNYEKSAEILAKLKLFAESQYGKNHPSTATIIANLASSYESQGLYDKAEPLYQRSLAIREKTLGPEQRKDIRARAPRHSNKPQ